MSQARTIADVIDRAVRDLEAKITLLTGAAAFSLHGDDAIGLRPMIFSDGPTGVRGSEFVGGKRVALFPNATLLAQAWDETAAERVGEMLAGEGRSQDVDVVLGPTVNLHRSPLGGRLFEAYAEDPLLSGRLAAAYIRGVQRYGVGACVKHYVANEAETERRTVDVRVTDAALRELYLLPFEICVADAHPWTIMAAYNNVNGVAATEQDELNNGVLKSEWGWDGLLMSDWGATKTAAPAANGGLDLVMPGPRGPWATSSWPRYGPATWRKQRLMIISPDCSGWPDESVRWTAFQPSTRQSSGRWSSPTQLRCGKRCEIWRLPEWSCSRARTSCHFKIL